MTQARTNRTRCNTAILFTLLHIGQKLRSIDASVQFHHQSLENNYHFSVPYQDKIEEMEAPQDQKLSVRLPSNTLLKYTSYKDVSILHFRVPSDSRAAYFSFKASEDSKSAFQRKCKAKDVTLHLKANSFPVISPENITFPKNFVNPDERFQVYSLQFQSDQQEHRINIQGPHIGSWFAVAFISWTDPNNDRIEQQGLSAACDTLLLAELSVSRFYPIILNDGQEDTGNLTSTFVTSRQEIQNASDSANTSTATSGHQKTEGETGRLDPVKSAASNEKIYKFYVPDDVGLATAQITFAEVCLLCPDIRFNVQANGFPLLSGGQSVSGNEYNYIYSTIIKPNQTEEISIEFYVQPSTWHYILLHFVSSADELFEGDPLKAAGSVPITGFLPKFTSKTNGQNRLQQQNETSAFNTEVHSVSYKLRIDFNDLEPHNESTKPHSQAKNDSKNDWQPERFHGIDFYALLRQSYHEFFMFDFDLQPDANGTVPALLNLTAQSPVGFAFELGEVCDIGGTLTFALSMKHERSFSTDLKPASPTTSPPSERGGILAEKLVSNPDDAGLVINQEKISRNNQSMQIIVCMHLGVPGIPTWPDKCRYGQRLMPATSIVNNTDLMGSIHVPFPESGLWYVTMGLYCHGAETARVTIIDSVKEFVRQYANLLEEMRSPCACADNAKFYTTCIKSEECLTRMNETETLKVKECMMDSKCTADYLGMTRRFEVHHKSATEQHFALDNCNTSVVFSVSSSPCVAGRCGRFGRCYHYMSGGFVFSTCVCMKGYRGWDCTEDSQVPSNMSILLASLLLTLSNLLFGPSIYLAFRRRYYTEGVIYFFAMFFSIFYHACDSGEDEYSFCLVKIGVLQFCDFYCGLLAIWVTLIAMAHVPQQFVSLLHMLGAILLAFGTELNKQSLWVFLAPALTGICLISTSWGIRCTKTRKWFPARRYLTIYMPLGMALVMIGLVCYAFLQTKQNYHVVHSIWHMVMAISIMCLLPSRTSFLPKC